MPAMQNGSLPRLLELTEVVRQLDPDMPIYTLRAFLLVAQAGEEGVMQAKLGEQLGLSQAALSRNVAMLTDFEGVGLKGLGLIVSEPIPENRKVRRLKLSPKGKRFAEKIGKLLE